jgi:hypothetical protein
MTLEYKFNRSSNTPPHAEDWDTVNHHLTQRTKFLELGAAEGRSMIKTAAVLMEDSCQLTCVDTWVDRYDGETDETCFDNNLDVVKQKYPSYTFTKVKTNTTSILAELITKVKCLILFTWMLVNMVLA